MPAVSFRESLRAILRALQPVPAFAGKDFPTDRRVPIDDTSPTFGKAREAAQAAGRAALSLAGEKP